MVSRKEICRLFGQLLAEKRSEAKLSQESLAKAVGLTRTSITNIERGRQPVNLHTLYLDVVDLLPSLPKKSIASPIPREQFQRLSARDRRELERLGSKDFNWLTKIAKATSYNEGQ
jgi:DNA-binding XRE family transcriptional regulator